jgi:hypothetical protein
MFKGTFCASSVRLVKNIIFSVEEPRKCRIDYPVEVIIELAIASFLDTEALSLL